MHPGASCFIKASPDAPTHLLRILYLTHCRQGCAHRFARCQEPPFRDRYVSAYVGDGANCSAVTSAYGGTGMVFSAAMLDALPEHTVRQLAPSLYHWGDYTLAHIIHAAGFALTWPAESAVLAGMLDSRR